MAIGTLMKKIQRQVRLSLIQPPSSGPAIGPISVVAAHIEYVPAAREH